MQTTVSSYRQPMSKVQSEKKNRNEEGMKKAAKEKAAQSQKKVKKLTENVDKTQSGERKSDLTKNKKVLKTAKSSKHQTINLSKEEAKKPGSSSRGSNAGSEKKMPAVRSAVKNVKSSTKGSKLSQVKSGQPSVPKKAEKTKDEEKKLKEAPPLLEETQMASPNYAPVKYNTDALQKQLTTMIERNKKNSLLSVAAHVIRFLPTDTLETCYHLDMYNPTKEHIIFRVESPPVPYLSVKPKIGYLGPGEARTVFLLFSFRCPRLPDDLVFAFVVHQTPTKTGHLPQLESDRKTYTTKNTRKIARNATFEHRWTVAVAFYAGEMGKAVQNGKELDVPFQYKCPGHHFEGNPPQLDNQGQIYDDHYDPDEHDDKSENLPSAAD